MKDILPLDINQIKNKPRTVGNTASVACPFCQTSKLMLENKVLESESFLWIENKFPTLKTTYQTVLIETEKCEEDFTNYSLEYAHELLEFAISKRNQMIATGNYNEVLLLKNHGLFSDSSIHHAHMQLVGLYESSYDGHKFEESIAGPVVFENQEILVTVSVVPQSEFYEFNLRWEKKHNSYLYVQWLQQLIRYIFKFKDGAYNSYNLAFHSNDTYNFMKVIPRKPSSIYYLGYGLKQTPNDTKNVAADIYKFHMEQIKN